MAWPGPMLAEDGILPHEAHGPALHKLNELYATWFALPETQQLASGLIQRLRYTLSPLDAS